MKNQILEIFKAYERETEWDGNAIPESMYDALANDITKLYSKTKRIGIIGGGFQGIICGIDEARTVIIAHEHVVRYPELPLTIVDSEAKEIANSTYSHQVEFALRISPVVIEKFKNQTKSLKASAAEAILALENFGEKMIDSDFHHNKKYKGHERPYKYHR